MYNQKTYKRDKETR